MSNQIAGLRPRRARRRRDGPRYRDDGSDQRRARRPSRRRRPRPPRPSNGYRTRTRSRPGSKPYEKGLPPERDLGRGEQGDYNVRFGGKNGPQQFEGLRQAPEHPRGWSRGQKPAAGRYEFTGSTRDDMGGGAFTPEAQDTRALALAGQRYSASTGRDLDADLQTRGFGADITSPLRLTWTSLRDNPGRATAAYEESLAIPPRTARRSTPPTCREAAPIIETLAGNAKRNIEPRRKTSPPSAVPRDTGLLLRGLFGNEDSLETLYSAEADSALRSTPPTCRRSHIRSSRRWPATRSGTSKPRRKTSPPSAVPGQLEGAAACSGRDKAWPDLAEGLPTSSTARSAACNCARSGTIGSASKARRRAAAGSARTARPRPRIASANRGRGRGRRRDGCARTGRHPRSAGSRRRRGRRRRLSPMPTRRPSPTPSKPPRRPMSREANAAAAAICPRPPSQRDPAGGAHLPRQPLARRRARERCSRSAEARSAAREARRRSASSRASPARTTPPARPGAGAPARAREAAPVDPWRPWWKPSPPRSSRPLSEPINPFSTANAGDTEPGRGRRHGRAGAGRRTCPGAGIGDYAATRGAGEAAARGVAGYVRQADRLPVGQDAAAQAW